MASSSASSAAAAAAGAAASSSSSSSSSSASASAAAAAASSVGAPKVVLRNTTKMSLNERFTEMLNSRQPMRVTIQSAMQRSLERERNWEHQREQKAKGEQKLEQKEQEQQNRSGTLPPRANSGNRKLAREMENRPSVRAALTLKADALSRHLGKSNIHDRLGWPFGSLVKRAAPGREDPSSAGMQWGQGSRFSRGSRVIDSREFYQSQSFQRSGRRGSVRRGLGWGGSTWYGGRKWYSSSMENKGYGSFGGRYRSHVAPITKEQLDSQLDAYMAKSREHLDAELEAYMTQKDD